MYKKTHKFLQSGADKVFMSNILPYDPLLTDEQNRENLVSISKKITAELLQLPKTSNKRKELGKQLSEINAKINKLRPKRSTSKDVLDYFVTATKEISGLATYKLIMDRAVKLMEEANL